MFKQFFVMFTLYSMNAYAHQGARDTKRANHQEQYFALARELEGAEHDSMSAMKKIERITELKSIDSRICKVRATMPLYIAAVDYYVRLFSNNQDELLEAQACLVRYQTLIQEESRWNRGYFAKDFVVDESESITSLPVFKELATKMRKFYEDREVVNSRVKRTRR